MTEARQIPRAQVKRLHPLTAGRAVLVFLSAFVLWYIIRDPVAASRETARALQRTFGTVIPSLFPFFVLSALLPESGLPERLGRALERPMRVFFGISGQGATALLLGLFAGFPVGARVVTDLTRRGALTREEGEYLLPLTNAPSFAFLYATVGAGMLGSRRFGILLYLSLLLSVLLVGLLTRKKAKASGRTSDRPYTHVPLSSARAFTSAISGAVSSSLSVAGYVVFFSILTSSAGAVLEAFHTPALLSTLLSGLLEITSGMEKAAETTHDRLCGFVLCGFFAGWGGLSAHLQVIATADNPLSDSPLPDGAEERLRVSRSYIGAKLLIGLFTALFMLLFRCFLSLPT